MFAYNPQRFSPPNQLLRCPFYVAPKAYIPPICIVLFQPIILLKEAAVPGLPGSAFRTPLILCHCR
jgi:hypothetical protein